MHPPLPSAGSATTSNRRASNGYIWVEDMANELSAKLLNYAWGGAIVDRAAYNSTKNVTVCRLWLGFVLEGYMV
jgi:hypothetical protein